LGRTITRPLVTVHAGALLNAQLPNPIWLQGKMWVGGSVLGGRIRFQPRRIGFEFGERCEGLSTSDPAPFARLDYIEEFIPGEGTKEVSVFVDPRVSFNINDGEIIQVTDQEGTTHTYKVEYEYALREKSSGALTPTQEVHWNEARSTLRITPRDWLAGKAWYDFQVRVLGYEYLNGSWGSPIFDTLQQVSFKTKARPTQFLLEDVISSYPGFRQRYFMVRQGDGTRAEGWLEMDRTDCYEILGAQQAANIEEGNIVRFTNIRTRQFTETPCWCKNNRTLVFNMPANRLQAEEIYRLNIGFREKEGYLSANPGADLDATTNTYTGATDLTADATNVGSYQQRRNRYADKSQFINKYKYQNLLDPSAQWYAKTSKYSSYQQKMAGFSVAQTAYLPYANSYSYDLAISLLGGYQIQRDNSLQKTYHVPVILLDPGGIAEPFDHFDIVGYQNELADDDRVAPVLNPYYSAFYYLNEAKIQAMRAEQTYQNVSNATLRQRLQTLTAGSPLNRSSNYPFFNRPNTRWTPLIRWMQNYDQLESALQAEGHTFSIQRPALPLRSQEINRFLDGASEQAVGGSFGLSPTPTHSPPNVSNVTFGVYTPPSPPAASNSFSFNQPPGNGSFDPGFDLQSTTNSYYVLIDWTPRIIHSDRVQANLRAVQRLGSGSYSISDLSSYLQALDRLDDMYLQAQLPAGTYRVKLVNELDKTTTTYPYQVIH
ncbi:MAG: hypothetical protein AAGJ82_06360, partial [Bacteroidota bacterium]